MATKKKKTKGSDQKKNTEKQKNKLNRPKGSKKHNIPWEEIKSYYLTHDVSLAETAEYFGVSLGSINRHAQAENWVAAKEETQHEIVAKVIQKEQERQAKLMS